MEHEGERDIDWKTNEVRHPQLLGVNVEQYISPKHNLIQMLKSNTVPLNL